jgi:hypothetical protein
MSVEIAAFNGTAVPSDVTQAVHRQWASRPADERFKELADLKASVMARRAISVIETVNVGNLTFKALPPATDGEASALSMASPALGALAPTHWAFGQMASLFGAPAAYLRKLPAPLAVQCLNHGAANYKGEQVQLFAADRDEACELRATTSLNYGRIWDIDVVEATERIVEASNGTFASPWAWGKTHRALFASDRDCFMFFCDGGSIVDGGGDRDQMHRGFYVWNSEVGSATFGIAVFMFRTVCGNYQIWGARDARVLKIRHTSGGPAKFVSEAIPALKAYAQDSVLPLEAAIKRAKAFMLPSAEDKQFEFFAKYGFTKAEVRRAKQFAEAEEGQFANLWDSVNGFTAAARMLAYADASVELSRRAGKLMEIVTE